MKLHLYNSQTINAPLTGAQLLDDDGYHVVHMEHKTANVYYLHAAGLDADPVHAKGYDREGKRYGEWDLSAEQVKNVLAQTRKLR